jgi:hypothetical protein
MREHGAIHEVVLFALRTGISLTIISGGGIVDLAIIRSCLLSVDLLNNKKTLI